MVAYTLFVLVAFGWRTWLQYRETGDTGMRGFSGGATARAASMLLLIGLLAAPLAAVIDLVQRPERPAILVHPALPVSGLVAFLLGFALTLAAQARMGASWRIGVDPEERTTLVTDGIFRHVRNPIFSGILVAVFGLVLLVPNRVAVAAALCTLAGLQIQVRAVEEPHLLRAHGEAYRRYARSAGRFVPWLGRLR